MGGENIEMDSSKKLALRILGNRNLSSQDIEMRLVNKGETAETARQVVEWLEDIGAVNDIEYAESIVRHYSTKGYGIARIKQELFKRGIDREMWEEALVFADDMVDAAFGFINKKLKGSCEKDDLRKAEAALCRRGFSYDEAREAMKKYMEEIGNDWEELS